MINLSESSKYEGSDFRLKGVCFVRNLIKGIMAQSYEATSVRDFLENQEYVEPTKNILFPAVSFCGAAVITFRNINYGRTSDGVHSLSDLTGSLDFGFHPDFSGEFVGGSLEDESLSPSNLETLNLNEGRLFEAEIVYFPLEDASYLLGVKVNDPMHGEKCSDKLPARLGFSATY